jgi:cytochrome c-type biogenesis protein CcmH
MARVVLVLALVLTAGARVGDAAPSSPLDAATVPEARVTEVAAQLRCVVCQSLSVADSPSEMAAQMRGIVREHLAAGETPEQVIRYFVDKYGEWILLAPARHGFTLLVWLVPPIAVLLGVALTIHRVRGWTRRAATGAGTVAVDSAMRARIQKELEAEP